MNSLSRILTAIILLSIFVSSCNYYQETPLLPASTEWAYTDLKTLDPADSLDPKMEIVAMYARRSQEEFQVRLDFLDLNQESSFEIYIGINTIESIMPTRYPTNKSSWELMIQINPSNDLETYVTGSQLRPNRFRIIRNPEKDTIIVSFSTNSFQSRMDNRGEIAAWIIPEGEKAIADSIGPAKLSTSPPRPVNVVLYFWNTFAAATPAEALRRWDGAHSGPDSSRHGLTHLLNAIETTHLPVILSDLNTPQNLSALDYLGVLDGVRHLALAGLISLPDVSIIDLSDKPVFTLPDWVFEKGLGWVHQVSQQFNLPNTYTMTARQWPSSLNFPPGYDLIFPAHISPLSRKVICNYGQVRLFCQSESDEGSDSSENPYWQVDEKGLTLETKKALINSAFSDDRSILLLGGDYGLSAWGIQGIPIVALDYLRNHPWIRVLSLNDLQYWATDPVSKPELPNPVKESRPFVPETANSQPIASGLNTEQINTKVLQGIEALSDSELVEGIWQWYYELLSANSEEQHRLNAATLGQIGHLLAGAQWARSPYPTSNCEVDLDWDGENECVLSSDKFFGSIEIGGANMVVGLLSTYGIHQFIAPTYQVYSGISDSFLWQAEKGPAGDGDAVAGAFVERGVLFGAFIVRNVVQGSIEFEVSELAMRKKFTLSDSNIEVDFHSAGITLVTGMFVEDPWERFRPLWADSFIDNESTGDTSFFGFNNFRVTTNTDHNVTIFTSSKKYLDHPENPNFDYTAGHYLLFPYTMFTITGRGDFWIRCDWSQQ